MTAIREEITQRIQDLNERLLQLHIDLGQYTEQTYQIVFGNQKHLNSAQTESAILQISERVWMITNIRAKIEELQGILRRLK